MYGLYGWLLAKGQLAFLNAVFDDKDFVAIYPEIYHGNETQAKTVVRYILAPPGEMQTMGTPGPKEFPETDLIYSFSKLIYDTDDDHTLFLPVLDLNLFKDLGKKRTNKCVFIGKGQDSGKHPEDCIKIDRNLAQNQSHLADFLNTCEVMYSYDHRSAMFEIARLCGCRVVILSDTNLDGYEPGLNGIGFGKDAKLDSSEFRKHYKKLIKIFSRRLDGFIEETQNIRLS